MLRVVSCAVRCCCVHGFRAEGHTLRACRERIISASLRLEQVCSCDDDEDTDDDDTSIYIFDNVFYPV